MSAFLRAYRTLFLPAGLLSGTIIGAGIFSLPYVFQNSGVSVGMSYLVLGTFAFVALHLLYADVIIRTPEEYRFVGYARHYWGTWAFWIGIAMTVVQMVFVMTVYLVLSLSFVNLVAPSGGAPLKLFLFWLLGSLAIFLNVRKAAFLQLLVTFGMIVIIILITAFGFFKGRGGGFPIAPDFGGFFLPLAPILFSLSGRVAVPALVHYFRTDHVVPTPRLLSRAVTLGTLIPALLYGLFVLGVLSISPIVSEDSVTGLLIGGIPPWLLLLIGILGLTSLWSSYFMIGLDVNGSLMHDLRWPRLPRFLLVLGGPLLLYAVGFQNFLQLVHVTGGIFLSLEGIFIVCLWWKANRVLGTRPLFLRKVRWVPALLSVLFAVAFLTQFL